MSAPELQTIQNTFTKCFKDSAVFERPEMHGRYFEVSDYRKDGKHWLIVAAGIDKAEGGDLFTGHPKRAENATVPLRFRGACEMAILFVARPFSGDLAEVSGLSLVAPFSPRQGIDWLELREAYVRIWDLPSNEHGLSDIRWEWDIDEANKPPREAWLREWKDDVGFNPAHSPSHLHLNTGRVTSDQTSPVRPGDRMDDLRLAIGKPNPLALILSIAAWLRNI